MANKVNHQEIVEVLLESKSVDFESIGRSIAELGPSIARADEPWEGFCGTMRTFIRIYRIHNPVTPVENLGDLGVVGAELAE